MIPYTFKERNDMIKKWHMKSHETLQHFKCYKQHRCIGMLSGINQISLAPDLLQKKEISFCNLYGSLLLI